MNRPTVSQADIQKHIEFTNESGECITSGVSGHKERLLMIQVGTELRMSRKTDWLSSVEGRLFEVSKLTKGMRLHCCVSQVWRGQTISSAFQAVTMTRGWKVK